MRFDGHGEQLLPVKAQYTSTTAESDWIALLENVGYTKSLLLEVSFPPKGHTPELEHAVAGLVDAREQILWKKPREAGRYLREVLDDLDAYAGACDVEALRKRQPDFEHWTVDERMMLVRWALRRLLAPSAHGGPSREIKYDPNEATAALAMVAGLVEWFNGRLDP